MINALESICLYLVYHFGIHLALSSRGQVEWSFAPMFPFDFGAGGPSPPAMSNGKSNGKSNGTTPLKSRMGRHPYGFLLASVGFLLCYDWVPIGLLLGTYGLLWAPIGFLWVPMGSYWVPVVFLLGSSWVPMGSYGLLLGSYGLKCAPIGFIWVPMGSYGLILGSYGLLWVSIGFLWAPMCSYGLLWVPIVFL